ncbi:hypothetical protein RRG08_042450 [Elysia crispata]|uniref:Uncharacterized protein n=1 Tax=Elysia crispata TaxID=231223 RepID=A0AAE0ZC42_9GAST|nr:hypothetical protein RRG08_042450 [Elysia crispata]
MSRDFPISLIENVSDWSTRSALIDVTRPIKVLRFMTVTVDSSLSALVTTSCCVFGVSVKHKYRNHTSSRLLFDSLAINWSSFALSVTYSPTHRVRSLNPLTSKLQSCYGFCLCQYD